MKKDKKNILISFILLTILLASCTTENNSTVNATPTSLNEIEETTSTSTWIIDKEDVVLKLSDSNEINITFDWTSIKSDWAWVDINGNILTITQAWNYKISWELISWQIIVDTEDADAVQLILSWVNITNQSTSPIYIKNAKQTVIKLDDNTKNYITDWKEYVFESTNSDEPNSAIFSSDDLIINWSWELTISGNYNDWISSKDTLVIQSWTINIVSTDDWIRWKDYVLIEWWNINIKSTWDAIKSDNEENGVVRINWWNIEISSEDDAIHAEMELEINNWTIKISKSYEWLESKKITINWWNIDLTSSDDWINVAWWNDWTTENMWNPMNQSNSNYFLYINWWTIKVNASWDWLDANGSIIMTWWEVYVNWPTSNGNWPLDYDGIFDISGWVLIASWSSWMAQNISATSKQNWILIWFNSSVSAWSNIVIKDSSGKEVISFLPTKTTQSIVISTPSIKKWETYTYFIDWVEKETFTISSITTSVWNIKTMWWPWMQWWDFDKIKTIMDKEKSGWILTDEEQKIIDEMQKKRPNRDNFTTPQFN